MKRLILVGGGHAHVEVLRQFAERPLPGLELALVSPHQHAAYSGMLPGWIAGRYQADDCRVDLQPLASRASARFLHDRVVGLNVDAGMLFCARNPHLPFDLISIDTGSRPPTWDTPGAEEHALAVKPIEAFMARWDQLFRAAQDGQAPRIVTIVGTGAAGLEVATAMQQRLAHAGVAPSFRVVGAAPELLPGHAASVRERYGRLLARRGIDRRLGIPVARVTADALQLADESWLESDLTVWVTGAGAPMWPRACGLATDAQGFIRVNACLQSITSPRIFAAGDVASLEPAARPKSGVYAVRAGPHLALNLQRVLRDEAPVPWLPQSQALALLSAGAGYAMASRGTWSAEGRWVWWWKNWIDRRWIHRYRLN
jgi:selenide,water dikinase